MTTDPTCGGDPALFCDSFFMSIFFVKSNVFESFQHVIVPCSGKINLPEPGFENVDTEEVATELYNFQDRDKLSRNQIFPRITGVGADKRVRPQAK